MNGIGDMLLPWDVSLPTILACTGAVALYVAGLVRGGSPGFWRTAAFLGGVLLMYAAMQTRIDYYAQYLFVAHRGQHAVLHHLGPFLVALSAPAPVLARGLPRRWRFFAGPGRTSAALTGTYRFIQDPRLAGLLFVALIAFWLYPSIHFDAMLSRRLYWLMNWSMAIDGLLFWWLVLAARPGGITPNLAFGQRLLLLVLVVPPQVLIGAGIALSQRELFDVYDVCGRALPVSALDDQQMGGLLTWIPAIMMSTLAALILLGRQLNRQVTAEAAR